jgi:hypothetical protein
VSPRRGHTGIIKAGGCVFATSGVATYLQLVQQVHQALRMGTLEPGKRMKTAPLV